METQSGTIPSEAEFKLLSDAYGLSLADGIEFLLPDSLIYLPPPQAKWGFIWKPSMPVCTFPLPIFKKRFCRRMVVVSKCSLQMSSTKRWHLRWFIGPIGCSPTTLSLSYSLGSTLQVTNIHFLLDEGAHLGSWWQDPEELARQVAVGQLGSGLSRAISGEQLRRCYS